MNNTATWLNYEFTIYDPKSTTWHDVGGIYIFCGVNARNQWEAKYIGQTGSFKDRLPNHDQWAEAVRLGATHVHARVVVPQAHRDLIEGQLVRAYRPSLNTLLK